MPAQVQRAVVLLWAALLLSILVTAIEFDPGEWKDVPAWFFGAFFVGSYAILAIPIVFVARRHNWARFAILVLFLGGLWAAAWFWSSAESWWTPVADVGFLALDAVALYWLFTGAGAAWFARRRGAQRRPEQVAEP